MKKTILYTNINRESVDGKKSLYRLMNAKETGRVIDLKGSTIKLEDFVIFERDIDDAITTVMIFSFDGQIYGTISRSFIDVFVDFMEAGFDPSMIDAVRIGSATSKKGRVFLTAEII